MKHNKANILGEQISTSVLKYGFQEPKQQQVVRRHLLKLGSYSSHNWFRDSRKLIIIPMRENSEVGNLTQNWGDTMIPSEWDHWGFIMARSLVPAKWFYHGDSWDAPTYLNVFFHGGTMVQWWFWYSGDWLGISKIRESYRTLWQTNCIKIPLYSKDTNWIGIAHEDSASWSLDPRNTKQKTESWFLTAHWDKYNETSLVELLNHNKKQDEYQTCGGWNPR